MLKKLGRDSIYTRALVALQEFIAWLISCEVKLSLTIWLSRLCFIMISTSPESYLTRKLSACRSYSLSKWQAYGDFDRVSKWLANVSRSGSFLTFDDALNLSKAFHIWALSPRNSTPFSLTLGHFLWHWGVQNTNYDIEINAICSVSVRF